MFTFYINLLFNRWDILIFPMTTRILFVNMRNMNNNMKMRFNVAKNRFLFNKSALTS